MNAAPAPKKRTATYPWQEPHVRKDLTVQINTRQPESLMLRVEYLAAEDGLSKRDLVEKALEEYVAREFKRRGLPA